MSCATPGNRNEAGASPIALSLPPGKLRQARKGEAANVEGEGEPDMFGSVAAE